MIGLVFGQQRFDHRLHPAGEDIVQRVQGQVDTVVGHPPLWIIVRTDALGTVARADQQLALGGDGVLRGAGLHVVELGRQPGHGAGTVLVLRALFLALDHDTGGQVGDPDRRVGLVDVLAAGTGCAIGIHPQVGRVDLDSRLLVRLGQYRHGARGGVDTALGFGLRHALHAVRARLELELAVHALAFDAGDDFLVAAVLAFVLGEDFQAPATLSA